MNFEVLVDDFFSLISTDNSLYPMDNKKVLSLINDFENGEWRYNKFQNFIWNNIKETALSYSERKALIQDGEDSVLTEAAKNLRLIEGKADFGKGSEISEIILYGIMKKHYNALPVVPKIFYKQNSQDNAKGSDSVHIVVEDDNNFSLWLGEAKFYNSIENSRLDKIVASVKESLSLVKLKKENSIITNLSDLNDFESINEELKKSIKMTLSQNRSIDSIKPILHIPILLLYECSITKSQKHLSAEYKNSIINQHKKSATEYYKRQIQKCSGIDLYSKINFHLILLPIADKERIVNKFLNKAQLYRS